MVTKNNTVKRCKFMIKKLLETPFNRLNMFIPTFYSKTYFIEDVFFEGSC